MWEGRKETSTYPLLVVSSSDVGLEPSLLSKLTFALMYPLAVLRVREELELKEPSMKPLAERTRTVSADADVALMWPLLVMSVREVLELKDPSMGPLLVLTSRDEVVLTNP